MDLQLIFGALFVVILMAAPETSATGMTYLGCFELGNNDTSSAPFSSEPTMAPNTTNPFICVEACAGIGLEYAASAQNGMNCLCSDEAPRESGRTELRRCRNGCMWHGGMMCADYKSAMVYKVTTEDNNEEGASLLEANRYLQEYVSAMAELRTALKEKKKNEKDMEYVLKKMQYISHNTTGPNNFGLGVGDNACSSDFADNESTIAVATKLLEASDREIKMKIRELDRSAKDLRNYQLQKIVLEGEKELFEAQIPAAAARAKEAARRVLGCSNGGI